MMQEAALLNVLKTILIIVLVYYGFRFVTRFVFPWLVRLFIRSVHKKFNQQNTNRQAPKGFEETKQGNVTIRYKKDKSTKKNGGNFKGGDYVDFEELE